MGRIHFIKLSFLYFLFSCTQSYQDPDKFKNQIDSMKTQTEKEYPRPQFVLMPNAFDQKGILLSRIQQISSSSKGPTRNIASTNTSPSKIKSKHFSKAKKVNSFSNYSNKRLYFMALYQQYFHLTQFFSTTLPDLDYCPNFHTNFLEMSFKSNPIHKEKADRRLASVRLSSNGDIPEEWNILLQQNSPQDLVELTLPRQIDHLINQDKNYLSLFPELTLSTDLKNNQALVWEGWKNQSDEKERKKLLSLGLSHHLYKIYDELNELCEYGQSQNYFIFENMISFSKDNPELKNSKEALQSLIKVNLVANHYLLSSLENYFVQQNHQNWQRRQHHLYQLEEAYEETLSRLSAQWTEGYFAEMMTQKRTMASVNK